MLTIERVRATLGMDAGNIVAKLDLQASESSDLPALGDVVESYKVAAGTIAQVIQTGQWATLDDDGTWYDEDGNAVEVS